MKENTQKFLLWIAVVILLLLVAYLFASGTKYQCYNGEVVDSASLCSQVKSSNTDCPVCTKTIDVEKEIAFKYQCYDGSIKDSKEDCRLNEDGTSSADLWRDVHRLAEVVIKKPIHSSLK